MTPSINPLTGLSETIHPHYAVPHVRQRNINALRLNGQHTAVHTVPLGDGLTLDFYAKLASSDELLVAFHGANTERSQFYPRFERVNSIKQKTPSFISVADPTIQTGIEDGLQLTWYLGTPEYDPLLMIAKVIRRAIGRTGSKHIAFVGGSGGGFAALRASAMWPGSLAFIQDPQTNIATYIPRVVDRYFQTFWPTWNQNSLLEAFPERFNMVQHYRNFQPRNFVYYAQNVSDTSHYQKHYLPFVAAHGMTVDRGVNPSGDRVFALFEGTNHGHGKITPDEFDHHFAEAIAFWRVQRQP